MLRLMLVATALGLWALSDIVAGGEADPPVSAEAAVASAVKAKWERIYADDDGQALSAFCEAGLLFDRGAAVHAFMGSSNQWIAEHDLKNDRFRKALADAPPFPRLADDSSPHVEDYQNPAVVMWPLFRVTPGEWLEDLSEAEFDRIGGVYLRLEGMLALGRPEFRGLLDAPDRGDRFVSLAQEIYERRIAPINRAYFTGVPRPLVPLYRVEVRRDAVNIDKTILLELSDGERKRLAKFLRDSDAFEDVITPRGLLHHVPYQLIRVGE